MEAVGLGRLVSSALDPALVPAGFQGGQYGDVRGGDLQITICAADDTFSRRHAGLPQAGQQQRHGTCVDLTVECWADGTLGRLDLEGTSVEQTLRHAGLVADADSVARMIKSSVVESIPVIEATMRRLFAATD